MLTYKIYALWAILLVIVSCEELNDQCTIIEDSEILDLYIDSDCQTTEYNAILNGVALINELSIQKTCDPVIEVMGIIDLPNKYKTVNLPLNVATCYYKEPEWFANSKYETKLGWGSYNYSIRLFSFKKPGMSTNYTLALTMHELMHYIGINKHLDNPDTVMHHNIGPLNTHYTKSDKTLFCDYLGC